MGWMISFDEFLNEKTSPKKLKNILDGAYKEAEKASLDFMKGRVDGEGRDGSVYVRFNATKKEKMTPEIEGMLLANGANKSGSEIFILNPCNTDIEDYDGKYKGAEAFAKYIKAHTGFIATVHKS